MAMTISALLASDLVLVAMLPLMVACGAKAVGPQLPAASQATATLMPGTYALYSCKRACDYSTPGQAAAIGALILEFDGPAGHRSAPDGCVRIARLTDPSAPRRAPDAVGALTWSFDGGQVQLTIRDSTPAIHQVRALVVDSTHLIIAVHGADWVPFAQISASEILGRRIGAPDDRVCGGPVAEVKYREPPNVR